MSKTFFNTLLFCFTASYLFGQKTGEMILVTYVATYKHLNNMERPNQEYVQLRVLGDKSFFQSYNEMRADSLRTVNTSDDAIWTQYYSHLKFAVAIERNQVTYNEVVLKDEFEYKETLNFTWDTNYNEKRTIGGYTAFKATTNYGGRDWTVWYASELPINAGPYKFKDLPGLILEARDDSGSYVFEFGKIARKYIPLNTAITRLYHLHSEDDRVKTSRSNFNELNLKIKNISKEDKMNAILTDTKGNSNGKFVRYDVGTNPEEPNSMRKGSKIANANPIELPN